MGGKIRLDMKNCKEKETREFKKKRLKYIESILLKIQPDGGKGKMNKKET